MRDDLYATMESIEHHHWWFVAKRRIIRSLIDRFLTPPPGGAVPLLVDIGCGTGGLLDDTKGRFEAIGLDSAGAAREAAERRGHTVRPCWLPDELPVDDASADVCVMSDVLEHVDEDRASVAAAASKLRAGGLLVCTVPAHRWLWTKRDEAHEHKRRYARSDYESLFAIDELEPVTVGWYMAWLMPLMLAERTVRRVFGDPEVDDLTVPMAPVNRVLGAVFAAERFTLGRIPFPIGASLISVHRRTA